MSDMKPYPKSWPPNYNGSNEPCDALVGPCSCGAWHREGELKNIDTDQERAHALGYLLGLRLACTKDNHSMSCIHIRRYLAASREQGRAEAFKDTIAAIMSIRDELQTKTNAEESNE